MATGFTDEQTQAFKDLMKVTFEEVLEEQEVVTRKDISHLPTKDEYYESQGELMAEIKRIREEQPVQAHQISRNADEIRKIKKHLNLPAFD